jgi:hypothetical protein
MQAVIAAAKAWHYWVGIALLIPTVLAVAGAFVAYLVKVTSNRYPKQQ